MSYYTWRKRKSMWKDGYYAIVHELMDVSKDWELDPMCDCVPARDIWTSTGKWRVTVFKTYIDNHLYEFKGTWHANYFACVCNEPAAQTPEIDKAEAINIWCNLSTKKIPLRTIQDHFASLVTA